jgi:hypothetical protein
MRLLPPRHCSQKWRKHAKMAKKSRLRRGLAAAPHKVLAKHGLTKN